MIYSNHRHSTRLPHHDYSSPGLYFVTVCAYKHQLLFGQIKNNHIILNNIGILIEKYWHQLTKKFRTILDDYIIMPNHIHGIIQITNPSVRVSFMKPKTKFNKPSIDILKSNRHMGLINQTPTLGHIIRYFKAITSKTLHQNDFNIYIWQRNYYEHIIKNEIELNKIRQYIKLNPQMWHRDRNNPNNIKKLNFRDCFVGASFMKPSLKNVS